jgi:hypothetical protein
MAAIGGRETKMYRIVPTVAWRVYKAEACDKASGMSGTMLHLVCRFIFDLVFWTLQTDRSSLSCIQPLEQANDDIIKGLCENVPTAASWMIRFMLKMILCVESAKTQISFATVTETN